MAIELFPMKSVNELARINRQSEYQKITDPMFMQVQRGELTMEEWQAAINNIKTKFPYVTEDLELDIPDAPTQEFIVEASEP